MREIGDVLRLRTRQHRLARVSNFAILAVGVSLMLAGSGQLLAQTNGLGVSFRESRSPEKALGLPGRRQRPNRYFSTRLSSQIQTCARRLQMLARH